MRVPPPVYAFFAGIAGIALATATMHEPAPLERERENPAVEAPAPPDVCEDLVTQAFVSVQLEAGLVSDLTLTSVQTVQQADELWDEIDARVEMMAATLAELADPRTGLSPAQTAQVELVRPFVDRMLAETRAARLLIDAREPNLEALAVQQDMVGLAAGAVLDLLVEGRECVPPPTVLTWAPTERCDTLDPEYVWAMEGPCID